MLDPLLALCARALGHPAHSRQLAALAATYAGWETLPARAEYHGLGPLVYKHVCAIEAPWPMPVRRVLQGQYVRQRHANAVRFAVLGEILRAFQAAGIDVLVLKGAALAQMVYPEPALRPMSDIDVLVRPAQAAAAQAQLTRLGFQTGVFHYTWEHHHLLPQQRTVEGVAVAVEVHHHLLFPKLRRPPIGLDELWPAAQALAVDGVPARTLGPADMLRHLYWHGFGAHVRDDQLRLIWVADLVSAVESWNHVLDWPALRRQEPALVRLLAQLDALTPWSPALADVLAADLRAATRPAWKTWRRRCWPADWQLVLGYQAKGLGGLFRHWARRA